MRIIKAQRTAGTLAKPELIAWAREYARDVQAEAGGTIEVDGDALMSEAENGTWVQAWIWIPKEQKATSL